MAFSVCEKGGRKRRETPWAVEGKSMCKEGLDVLHMPWDCLLVREAYVLADHHCCLWWNPAGGTRHTLALRADQALLVMPECPAGGWERGQWNKAVVHFLPFGGILAVSSECVNHKGKYTLNFLSGNSVFVSLARWKDTQVSISHLLNWSELPSSQVTFKGGR